MFTLYTKEKMNAFFLLYLIVHVKMNLFSLFYHVYTAHEKTNDFSLLYFIVHEKTDEAFIFCIYTVQERMTASFNLYT